MSWRKTFAICVTAIMLFAEIGSLIDHEIQKYKNQRLPKHLQKHIEPRISGTEAVLWYLALFLCIYASYKTE